MFTEHISTATSDAHLSFFIMSDNVHQWSNKERVQKLNASVFKMYRDVCEIVQSNERNTVFTAKLSALIEAKMILLIGGGCSFGDLASINMINGTVAECRSRLQYMKTTAGNTLELIRCVEESMDAVSEDCGRVSSRFYI